MLRFEERDLRLAVNHLAFDMFHFRLYVQMYEDRMHIHSHRAPYQAVIYSSDAPWCPGAP